MLDKFSGTNVVPLIFLGTMALISGCVEKSQDQKSMQLVDASAPANKAGKSEEMKLPENMRPQQLDEPGLDVTPIAVPAEVREIKQGEATYKSEGAHPDIQIPPHEIPGPAAKRKRGFGVPVPEAEEGSSITPEPAPQPLSWTGSSTRFTSTTFADNGTVTGSLFIPPDSSAAAGPNHVVNVVNATITFHDKAGGLIGRQSLKDFFTLASPGSYTNPQTFTFDPKVIYDQVAQRFVVVTLEHIDNGPGDRQSRIYLAVSDDSDPTGTWLVTSINSRFPIGAYDCWADYPGFAVDEEAVYLTANMFDFATGTYGGARLWIIGKGESGGFYAGGAASVSVFNPYVTGTATTTQPAHIFGTAPVGVGTFLVSYSGLSDGVNEYARVVRVDSPLTAPSFTQQYINLGNIEDVAVTLPDAPQSGDAHLIETNDRRALHSVWQNNKLWLTTTIVGSGADSGQATAYWIALDTSTPATLAVAGQGAIGGEDIAAGAHTFFPSIAVNSNDNVAIGFSASDDSIYPGAYFTTRSSGDDPGITGASQTVQAGTDFYYRTFSGTSNRWGDYSGAAVDPVTECLWVYNQYAMSRGTETPAGQDGRWGTAYAETCPCTGSQALIAEQWKMFSPNCNLGSDKKVSTILGDDFVGLTYDSDWVVYRRDATGNSYVKMALADSLVEGQSYWVVTSASGRSITTKGINNASMDTPLIADAASGRYNMVGTPFNSSSNWADVRIIDGASALTLAEADPGGACEASPVGADCVMSRVMHKWNGASYNAYDGVTSGMEGTLAPLEGFWVKAFRDSIALRVQAPAGGLGPVIAGEPGLIAQTEETAVNETAASPSAGNKMNDWYIRLIAEAGDMRDAGNVLGQLSDSSNGYDKHDLKEMKPFDQNRYLTIVFPHDNWGNFSGDYGSDFHASTARRQGEWNFRVMASNGVHEVDLSFEGADNLFNRAVLIAKDGRKTTKYLLKNKKKFRFPITGNSRDFKIKIR